MTALATPGTGSTSHVEACCSTGSSPGRTHRVQLPLRLERGGTLHAGISCVRYGPEDAPPVVVLGGISADRHLAPDPVSGVAGWWPGVAGPGTVLDTDRLPLLGVDWLSRTAAPAGAITSSDQARALVGVLDALEIETASIVGASYGGMVGLAFAQLFPDRLDGLLVLCAAHRTHPLATGLRSVQRRIARFAGEVGRPEEGLALARALAMITYRSAAELDRRFEWRGLPVERAAADRPTRFPVEEYLDARGRAFAERFTTEAFATLSESIDLHDVDPGAIVVPTTLVSVDSDTLVPPWLVEELARTAPGVVGHRRIESIYGHDAFLKEVGLVSRVVSSWLGEEATR